MPRNQPCIHARPPPIGVKTCVLFGRFHRRHQSNAVAARLPSRPLLRARTGRRNVRVVVLVALQVLDEQVQLGQMR